MPQLRRIGFALAASALMIPLAACGNAGDDEFAFCEAVGRYDAVAAKALFDTGQIDMAAQSSDRRCQPAMDLFDRARPGFDVFITMAVAVAKQPGIATSCWTGSRGSSGKGSSGSGQRCPIEAAALNGTPQVMQALIENGASLTDATAIGALSDVVTSGSIPTLKLMVEGGADKNRAFTAAVVQANREMIDYLAGIGAVEQADPLLVAARTGDLAVVDAAIAARANLEVQDGIGRTPMMRAATYGQAQVIDKLARAGARIDARLEYDFDLPIHMAVRGNHAAAVRALAAAGANLNARADGNSPTPVILAVRTGSVQALAALVDAKADVNVGIDGDTTAIGRAIELGNLALVKQLIRGGARVNDKGGPGWQPPIHATLNNCGLPPEGEGENDNFRMNMLKTLIAAGADPKAVNDKGETALVAIARLRAEAEPFEARDPQGFRKACFQAKLDYLKSLR
jgi:ankyrin repeat protein